MRVGDAFRFYAVLRGVIAIGALLIVVMMLLGRIGAGIGAAGLVAVLAVAFVNGSIQKRKLRAELARIDEEFPSKPDV